MKVVYIDSNGILEDLIIVAGTKAELKRLADSEDFASTRENITQTTSEEDTYWGCTYWGPPIVIHLSEELYGDADLLTKTQLVAHEASHVIDMCFDSRGVDPGQESMEVRSLLLEWLIGKLLPIIAPMDTLNKVS